MELIRGLHNLRERHRGCVLSIGNFDGFHRGHQALVARLREHSQRLGVPAVVQVFEPTPREFFAPGKAPGRIATFRDKLAALNGAGVSQVFCVRFDKRFAAMAAEQYVKEVLVKRLGVKALVVGDDFRFGAGRGGDVALLVKMGASCGFVTEALGTVEVDGARASSSALREALAKPDLARAAKLLGRPYALSGRVRHGQMLGRKLGMPTVNLHLRLPPALHYGVYAVRVACDGRQWDGVANIGVRPTLARSDCVLEAHLFDAREMLYGKVVEVRFLKFLRDELRFDSIEALGVQMQRDGEDARAFFRAAPADLPVGAAHGRDPHRG